MLNINILISSVLPSFFLFTHTSLLLLFWSCIIYQKLPLITNKNGHSIENIFLLFNFFLHIFLLIKLNLLFSLFYLLSTKDLLFWMIPFFLALKTVIECVTKNSNNANIHSYLWLLKDKKKWQTKKLSPTAALQKQM